MSKTVSFLIVFIVIIVFSCHGHDNRNTQKPDSLKIRIEIINEIAIGWGYKYQAVVKEVVCGNAVENNDTIFLGITANREFDYLHKGDERLISFYNTGGKNNEKYFPAINGIISKQNYIWLISKIEMPGNFSERTTFSGMATTFNGVAVFIYDYALSESYYLDGLQTWDDKYLNKKIRIEGVLIQFEDGKSVIKDWKVIGCE